MLGSGSAGYLNKWIDGMLIVTGVILGIATLVLDWDGRQIAGYFAIILMFAANIPYCIGALKGTVKPHVVTWLLLAVITGLSCLKSWQEGATAISLVPLAAAAVMNVINSAMGWRYAKKHFKASDIACLLIAGVAIYLWRTVNDPLWVVVCLTVASLAAFVPTIRKVFSDPASEPVRVYARNTVRYCLITLAIDPYSILTLMYPATWIAVNGLFCLWIVACTKWLAARNAVK